MDQSSSEKLPWVRSRKALLRQIKARVRSYIESPDPEILDYRKQYSQEFEGNWSASSLEQLNNSLSQHRLALGGDFHAFAQSQRGHLRVLRQLEMSNPVFVGLECIESKYQDVVDSYQKGSIPEEEFLGKVKWDESWGFDWQGYKPLFELAKEKGYRLIALNFYEESESATPMALREEHSVKVLSEFLTSHPEAFFYVIYGDLHLASAHLPSKLTEKAKIPKNKILRVFQNSEELYFSQVREHGELETDIYTKDASTYCILGAPPWVQWQNYLMFLENSYDWELDEHELDIELHIQSFLKIIINDLKLSEDISVNDFAVYSPADDSVWDLLSANYDSKQLLLAQALVENERSFFMPMSSDFYLGRASVNHATSAIGHYIQSKLGDRDRSLWHMPKDFLPLIWCEALSFFVSLLINPKRKPDDLDVIKRQLEVTDLEPNLREAFSLVLEQRLSELLYIYSGSEKPIDVGSKHAISFLMASRILGGMLGDRLFQAYKAKEIDVSEIQKLLATDVEGSKFSETYLSLVRKVEKFRKKTSQLIL